MPPEFILDRPCKVNAYKCDIYSFGMTLWELYSGGNTPLMAEFNKINTSIHDDTVDRDFVLFERFLKEVVVKGIRPKLDARWPHEIKMLMEKCWNNNPSERPTAKEILAIYFLFQIFKLENIFG